MKKSKMVYLMMAAALLASCSADQEGQEMAGGMPISLGYSVEEVQTRAATNLNNGTIPNGESVAVLIKKSSDASFTSYVYEAGGTAGNLVAPTPAPEYPSDGAPVDIMAFYPHNANAIFTVKTDQTSDDNYKASDLMVASPILSQYRSPGKVKLHFYHKMAKIIVNASPAAGSSFTITGVSLTAKPKVDYNSSTGSVTLASTSNDATTITMTNGGAALIPAQTITGGFITVTTSGGTATYSVNGKPFEMGHQYTIDLSVSVTDLGMTNDITDWIVETTESGSTATANSLGELTNIVNSGGAFSEYLGKYVDANGNILTSSTNATGIIAYISTSDVDEDVPGSRILVLAKDDISGTASWGTEGSLSGASTVSTEYNGYNNTIILRNKFGDDKAAGKCWNYSASRPSLSSKWFLPSMAQWLRFMQYVDRSISGVSEAIYWSSTDYQNNVAYILTAAGGGSASSKGSSYKVRACYAYPSVYASLTSVHVGQLLTSEGHVFYDKASAEAAGETPVAMIVYVGDPGTADSSPGAEHYRGLAIALENASTEVQWFTENSGTCSYSNSTFSNHYNYVDIAGIAYTNQMANGTGSCSGHTHAAAQVAKNYSGITPPGCSQWFLPTSGQWFKFFRNPKLNITWSSDWAYCDDGPASFTKVNKLFTDAGVATLFLPNSSVSYWANSAFRSTDAIDVRGDKTNGINLQGHNKTGYYWVRAFLAF